MTGDGEAVGAPLVEGYSDLAVIGRGGFATVYRARQERFDRVVALKVLDRFDPSAEDRERFERECRAVGSLSRHPNIVVVHDSGVTADGRLYLAMEHLEGGSLAARVHHDGPLPWPDVARVGVEVAGALDTAQQAARDRYFAPVLAELRPMLRLLWPGAELRFDGESLLPADLVRDGKVEPIGTLSGGTREQISLLVRLAFARLLARSGRHAPVILDDALVYTDDARMEAMFDALTLQAQDLQILVLSCRNRALRDLGGRKLRFEPVTPGV